MDRDGLRYGDHKRKGKEQTNQLREIRNREKKYNKNDESVTTSYFTPSLVEICAKAVADDFPNQVKSTLWNKLLRPPREDADAESRDGLKDNSPLLKLVTYQLSTDLPLDVCVTGVHDEQYWQERCKTRWQPKEGQLSSFIKYKEDPGALKEDVIDITENQRKPEVDWKRTYLERHLELFIMKLDDNDVYDEATGEFIENVEMYRGEPYVDPRAGGAAPSAAAAARDERLQYLYDESNLDPKSLCLPHDPKRPNCTPWQVLHRLCDLAPDKIQALELNRLRCHVDWVSNDDPKRGGVCEWLTHLKHLRITYGVLDAQMYFRDTMFGIRKEDIVGRGHERGGGPERGLVRVLREPPLHKTQHIRHLALPENQINDDMTKGLLLGLVRNRTVETLDLSHNIIGCDGARAIAALLMKQGREVRAEGDTSSDVSSLDLSDNLIRVGGGRALGKALMLNKYLRVLRLRLNRLTDDGGKAIVDGLKENTSLRELTLACNELGNQSAQSFADALKCNATIRQLDLCGNNFSEDDGKLLRDAVRKGPPEASLIVMDCRSSGVGEAEIEAINEALKARVDKRKREIEMERKKQLDLHVDREVKDWKERFYSEDRTF